MARRKISQKGIERLSQLFRRVSILEQQLQERVNNTNVANSHYLVSSGEFGIPGIVGDVPGTATCIMLRRWGNVAPDEKPLYELGTKQKVYNAFGPIEPNTTVIVHRDDHGDLWVGGGGQTKVFFVQAPSGGIPARIRSNRPGKADCQKLIEAPVDVSPGTEKGDLFLHPDSIEIYNWTDQIAGADGSRIVQVDRHADGAWVIGWICDDDGDPDFPEYDPDDPGFWDPILDGNCEFNPDGSPNPSYDPGEPSSVHCFRPGGGPDPGDPPI